MIMMSLWASRSEPNEAAIVGIPSASMSFSSPAMIGVPSSSSSASTLSLTSAYAADAPVVEYLWSLVTNSTLRSQTLPFAFQKRVRPCSMPSPAALNGPVRSVSTPSVMVSAVTPTSVLSAPPAEAAGVAVSVLVEQAPAASRTAARTAAVAAPATRPGRGRLRGPGDRDTGGFSFVGCLSAAPADQAGAESGEPAGFDEEQEDEHAAVGELGDHERVDPTRPDGRRGRDARQVLGVPVEQPRQADDEDRAGDRAGRRAGAADDHHRQVLDGEGHAEPVRHDPAE